MNSPSRRKEAAALLRASKGNKSRRSYGLTQEPERRVTDKENIRGRDDRKRRLRDKSLNSDRQLIRSTSRRRLGSSRQRGSDGSLERSHKLKEKDPRDYSKLHQDDTLDRCFSGSNALLDKRSGLESRRSPGSASRASITTFTNKEIIHHMVSQTKAQKKQIR